MTLKLQGTFTALVTPFTEDGGAVDYVKLRELVEWQIQEGINGLVPHDRVIAEVVATVNGRVPVIAGTGSNSTVEALRLTRAAKEHGADACLVVCPYYNKPTQKGLYAHFKAVAEVGLPVVVYNIPGRTNVNLSPETIAELYKLPNIVAIKESTGSLDQAMEIAALCDITILSGDDNLTLPLMAMGATGVISVLSNASPKKVLAVTEPMLKGDYATARKAAFENLTRSPSKRCCSSWASVRLPYALLWSSANHRLLRTSRN
uniref:4-hydroxy-tetrahydrodipicolinate synthase n=1 Tax=Hyaloperonospora arabidopsidis (strain Emoy2) TaxID=559515 RepID=M4BR34_HYAAE